MLMNNKKSVLLIYPSSILHTLESGEDEIKCIKIGLELLGCKCDIIGLFSEDINSYDFVFIFSTSPILMDELEFLSKQVVVLFPLTELYDENLGLYVENWKKKVKKLYIVTRNFRENTFYSDFIEESKLIFYKSFFIKPFSVDFDEEQIYIKSPYALVFSNYARIEHSQFDKFVNDLNIFKLKVLFFSINNNTIEKENVLNYKRIKHCSKTWYQILSNASYFYEPNDRITSSILEALWLGIKVISPHAEILNELLGLNAIFKDLEEANTVNKIVDRKYLNSFQVQNVVKRFLIGIE